MAEGCPFEPLLSAWLDGELGEAEAARVGAHLEGCADCACEVAGLREVRAHLRNLSRYDEEEQATPDVLARTRADVERLRRAALDPLLGPPPSRPRVAVAAGLVVVVMLASALLGANPDREPLRAEAPPDEAFYVEQFDGATDGLIIVPAVDR